MDDLLIRGATVIDDTGAAPRLADVAVRDGRISAVEPSRTESATREIDAATRVSAPGFIDIHTHSDFTLPLNPLAEAKRPSLLANSCGIHVQIARLKLSGYR